MRDGQDRLHNAPEQTYHLALMPYQLRTWHPSKGQALEIMGAASFS
jgi:hypothetical protein